MTDLLKLAEACGGMEPLELGDVIECDVQNPYPATLRCRLVTPEALSYGRRLVWGKTWRKSKDQTPLAADGVVETTETE
jgi:hypothetical protein